MGRPKLQKFAELANMPNVFQKDASIKGKWQAHFNNTNPIVLELACGKGDYARAMAQLFADKNYIGFDIKGNRLWTAANLATQSELKNVAFVRDQIDHIEIYFEQNAVDEIWITFPDPFLRESRAKKRLTSPKFLTEYKKVLKPGGLINLKTDSPELYAFTLEVIEELDLEIVHNHKDIYLEGVTEKTYNIQTHYEKMHLKDNRTIKFLSFKL